MSATRKKYLWAFVTILVLATAVFLKVRGSQPQASITSAAGVPPVPTFTPALVPVTIPIEDSPLKDSIIAAGDYLVRQQLPNGELSYQVDVMTSERSYSPSY